jgi:hypothetical protein
MQQRARAQSAANGAIFSNARAMGQYNNAMVNGALAKNMQNRNMFVFHSLPSPTLLILYVELLRGYRQCKEKWASKCKGIHPTWK